MKIYSICQAIGFITDYNIFKYNFMDLNGIDSYQWDTIYLLLICSAVIGSRVMSCIQGDVSFNQIHLIYNGGVSIFGAYYGALTTAYILCKIYNMNPILFFESVILSASFHTGLVRIGNYFNGELIGKYSNFLGDRHPSQLYQFFGEGVILSSVQWYFKYTIGKGIIFMLTPMLYCVVRCICEYFKEEEGGVPDWFKKSLHKYIRWAHFQSLCLPIAYGLTYLIIK